MGPRFEQAVENLDIVILKLKNPSTFLIFLSLPHHTYRKQLDAISLATKFSTI